MGLYVFSYFFMKEPDYNIMMMSNFSGLTVPEGQKEEIRMVNGGVSKFKYPEVVSDNLFKREEMDNHNALRYYGRIKP